MKKYLLLFISLLNVAFIFSQKIEGTVKDNLGDPMIGVSVINQRTKENTVTDINGKFEIGGVKNDILNISYIGYETTTITAGTTKLDIVMKDQITNLDAVVVVGYGTKKVGAITGSVTQVKSEDITKNPAQSAIQAIQGRAVGVNIVTNDEPGKQPTILIRGLGTVLSGYEPLYVIDGVEANGLGSLSTNDIETIDILKDASSLAIYGQKGSNGVVLVTTKKGKKGDIKVNLNSYYGVKAVQKKVKMADWVRYGIYNNTARGSFSFYNTTVKKYDTDWFDEITGLGNVVNNALTISGGGEFSNYSFGITNYQEKGILNGADFNRTNLISKNDFKLLGDKLKITQFFNLSATNKTPKPLTAFTSAYKQAPIMPVKYEETGRFAVPIINSQGFNDISGVEKYNNVSNPAADLYFSNVHEKFYDAFGSLGAEVKILKSLKFNSNFGANYEFGKGYSYNALREIWLYQNPTENIGDYPNPDKINSVNQYRSDNTYWNWDNYFTYSKKINIHDITAVLGMSRSTTNNFEYLGGTRYNVPEQSNYWFLNFSTNNTLIDPGTTISNNHSTPIVNLAYFGRFEYTYNDKYLLSTSLRREGISSFQKDKRYAVFPAVSLGWVLSNESFFKKFGFLNYLKLRGGFGIVGNGRGTPSVNTVLFQGGNNYAFGTNQQINPGTTVPYQVDPNLTWENMKEFDLGIDYKLNDYKLSGSLDFYNRVTDKIILPVSYPAVLSPGSVYVNAGKVTNRGVELALNYKCPESRKYRYTLGGNLSFNDNKLSDIYNDFFKDLIGGGLSNGISTKKVVLGEALGSFWVYEVKGKTDEGNFTYSTERKIVGSYLPKFTLGLNYDAYFNNFDFSVQLYGVAGNKIYNGKKAQRFGGENVEYALLKVDDYWSASNPDSKNPKPFNDIPAASTYYVEDGSYLRINNITVGYTLPKLINKVNNIRLYFTALNPYVLTGYSGYSPEISGSPLGGAGVELDAYPTNKTFLIGLNLNL